MTNAPAVVLLSGGIDSAVTAAAATRDGYAVHALTFRYGQRHAAEVFAAEDVAQALNVAQHRMVDIDLRAFGGSALTDDGIAVPRHDSVHGIGGDVPATYVPARNTIFLAYTVAWAEVLGAADIFIGVNGDDYVGYPDCRPEYLRAFEKMANLATWAACDGALLRIHAPLAHSTKSEIIRQGITLGVDFALTHSCYDPHRAAPCGRCAACLLRAQGFALVGVADPALFGLGG